MCNIFLKSNTVLKNINSHAHPFDYPHLLTIITQLPGMAQSYCTHQTLLLFYSRRGKQRGALSVTIPTISASPQPLETSQHYRTLTPILTSKMLLYHFSPIQTVSFHTSCLLPLKTILISDKAQPLSFQLFYSLISDMWSTCYLGTMLSYCLSIRRFHQSQKSNCSLFIKRVVCCKQRKF